MSRFITISLYGNITVISYSVNNIGIDKNVQKLGYFLKTWFLYKNNKNNDDVVDVNKFYDRFKLEESVTKENRNMLINLVYNKFRKMFDK